MARSQIDTLMPLDRFAAVLQIDPLHFNGVISVRRPLRNACDDVWFQHDYQFVGRCSRDAAAMAIRQCEDLVAQYFGFDLLPRWVAAEDCQIDRFGAPEMFGNSLNIRGLGKSTTVRRGYIIGGGVRAVEVIQLAAAVTYTDTDGDGYAETVTATAPTAVPDTEVHAFYPGESADITWEIRPVTVSSSGGVVTVTFRREQAVLPELMERLTDLSDVPPSIDGDEDANFLTTIDIYRVYNDPSQQATFYSEGSSCASCGGNGCAACDFDVESGCLTVRDPRLGLVAYQRADWDATSSSFNAAGFSQGREPDRLKVWYRAGWQDTRQADPLRTMDPTMERMLAYFAVSKLNTDAPACDNTRHLIRLYQEDLAKSQSAGNGVGQTYQLSDSDLRNPFGTARGALDFWRYGQTMLLNVR